MPVERAEVRGGGATLHRARWVIQVGRPPIADGAVCIKETAGSAVVSAVGPYRDVRAGCAGGGEAAVAIEDHGEAPLGIEDHGEAPLGIEDHGEARLRIVDRGEGRLRIVDHGEAVILPALVNAHTHLELSLLAGRVPPGLGFTDWLERVGTALAAAGEAEAREAIETAIGGAIAAGTGLVGDVSDTGWSAAALARAGLPARILHEVVAFDPRRAEVVFAEGRARLESLEAGSGPFVRHSLAPHAPYSVSARLLRLIRGFNRRDGRPTSIHLAESAAEEEFFMTGGGPLAELKRRLGTTVESWEAPGQPPVTYLARLGWFEAPVLAVHGTQLSARSIGILREALVTVCLCPRSNRRLGVGVAPARALAAAGVPLALGTDSLASADTLSVFDEMAAAAADYGLEPALLVEAATRGGARALGFGGELGDLAPGRMAAAIAVAAPAGTRVGEDPYALLLGSPGSGAIRWLAGAGAGRESRAGGESRASQALPARGGQA